MSEMVVQVTGVTKNYDGFSLSNISFDVKCGKIMAVFGNQGSGKTQILDSMMNMIDIDGGKIRIFGYDVSKVEKQVKMDISVIYGDYQFDDGITVTGLNPIFKNIYKNWSQETYFAYLERFGILPNTNIRYLPKGTNIIIQVAAALSHDSKLLIIDEPIRDVDPEYVPMIKQMLLEYIKESDNSVLLFSSEIGELEDIVDSIAILDKGKILLTGTKEKILNSHAIVEYVKGKPFRMDSSIIAGFEKSSDGATILINNIRECLRKHPDLEMKKASIRDVMKFYVMDNTNKS